MINSTQENERKPFLSDLFDLESYPYQDQLACKILKLYDKKYSRKWAETIFLHKGAKWLWPSKPKINEVHVPTLTNQHVKF